MIYQVIFNPAAGMCKGGDAARFLKDRLRGAGVDVRLHRTDSTGHGREIARKVSVDGGIIVAVGGDGTLNEVTNGIMESGASPILGIVPTGSGNDTVKCLGIENEFERCCAVIMSNRKRAVDVGRCNDRYFLNICGIGFDAAVGHRMHQLRLKGGSCRGKYLYNRALIECIARYRSQELAVDIDGEKTSRKYFLVCAANGTTFGGDFIIAPMADLSSGKLVIVCIEHISKPRFFRHLGKVRKGKKLNLPEVRYTFSKRIVIESNEEIPAQLDGEHYMSKTFDIEIIPARLEILVP